MRSFLEKARLNINIVDAMALIAATACGLASVSLIPALMDPGIFIIYKHSGQYPLLVGTITLLAWTVSPLIPTLNKRRGVPNCRTEEPGIIACIAVVASLPILIIANLGYGLALLTLNRYLELYAWIIGPILASASYSGIAVAAAWITLAVAGQWRSVMSWSDFWGRTVGILWIILSMCAKSIEVILHT
jgi:hypothetical protein